MYVIENGVLVNVPDEDYLEHYRTKGSKNGQRLYQNKDGSLTPLGRIHYGYGKERAKAEKVFKAVGGAAKKVAKAGKKAAKKISENREKAAVKKAIDKEVKAQKKADAEAKKLEAQKAEWAKSQTMVEKHSDKFTTAELKEINERFKLQKEMRDRKIDTGVEMLQRGASIAKAISDSASAVQSINSTVEKIAGKPLFMTTAKKEEYDRKVRAAEADVKKKEAEAKNAEEIAGKTAAERAKAEESVNTQSEATRLARAKADQAEDDYDWTRYKRESEYSNGGNKNTKSNDDDGEKGESVVDAIRKVNPDLDAGLKLKERQDAEAARTQREHDAAAKAHTENDNSSNATRDSSGKESQTSKTTREKSEEDRKSIRDEFANRSPDIRKKIDEAIAKGVSPDSIRKTMKDYDERVRRKEEREHEERKAFMEARGKESARLEAEKKDRAEKEAAAKKKAEAEAAAKEKAQKEAEEAPKRRMEELAEAYARRANEVAFQNENNRKTAHINDIKGKVDKTVKSVTDKTPVGMAKRAWKNAENKAVESAKNKNISEFVAAQTQRYEQIRRERGVAAANEWAKQAQKYYEENLKHFDETSYTISNGILMHSGVRGQRWGERRYQFRDGHRTVLGKTHDSDLRKVSRKNWRAAKKLKKLQNEGNVVEAIKSEESEEVGSTLDPKKNEDLKSKIVKPQLDEKSSMKPLTMNVRVSENPELSFMRDRENLEREIKDAEEEERKRGRKKKKSASRAHAAADNTPYLLANGVLIVGDSDYLAHWLKKGEKPKYIQRIRDGKRYRYFYTQDQLDAYRKKSMTDSISDEKERPLSRKKKVTLDGVSVAKGEKIASLIRPLARKKNVTSGVTGVHKGESTTKPRPLARKKNVTSGGKGVHKGESTTKPRPLARKKNVTSGGKGVHKRKSINPSHNLSKVSSKKLTIRYDGSVVTR